MVVPQPLQGSERGDTNVPLPEERGDLVIQVHRDMGHFGTNRILDRLKRNYWWKGMDEQVANFVRACMPCANQGGIPSIRKGITTVDHARDDVQMGHGFFRTIAHLKKREQVCLSMY